MKLPRIVQFDETAFPALDAIFRDIDQGIAALIAGDPAFQPKRPASRRSRAKAAPVVAVTARPRRARRAVAA